MLCSESDTPFILLFAATTLNLSLPTTSPSPTSPAPTISAAPSPDTAPKKQVNGASQGKYDEGNAQGGNNGKGYGVGGDPKDCSKMKNEKAKKKCLSKLKKTPWN